MKGKENIYSNHKKNPHDIVILVISKFMVIALVAGQQCMGVGVTT